VVDLLALMIASFSLFSAGGAIVGAIVGYLVWGWLGAALGLVVGYGVGLWIKAKFWDVPISARAKGWLSLLAFLGGLTVLAIATR
jgi:hypothetical protein